MPYKIRKSGEECEVYNPDTEKVYGKHKTKKSAEDKVAALYANASPEDENRKLRIRRKL